MRVLHGFSLLFISLATVQTNLSIAQPSKAEPTSAQAKETSTCPAVLNHKIAPLLDDKAESLCKHSGKVVLVVNTASQCGFTPQYEGLEKIYRKYEKQGFIVLGFPANDFGSQEKGTNEQIAKFCKMNFGVSFPMYQKLNRPINDEPLFTGLIAKTNSKPQWNFHKYLISREGKVQAFESGVNPESKELVQAIEVALKATKTSK
jgi:glutathione peroxidase